MKTDRLCSKPRNLLLVAWLMLMLPVTAAAEEAVGRVLSVVGDVVAVREDVSARSLARGDEVFAGDTLRTGERGRIQVRFIDDGLIDLRPQSTFEIEEYREGDDGDGGSAVMNFLQGAMRTITGAIGEDPGDDYRMGSPVATIGVRGTDYSLQFCDADCADVDRDQGLYGRVDDGSVAVTNEAGTGEFGAGEYFYVADANTVPQRTIAAPAGVLDGSEDGDPDEEEEEETAETEEEETETMAAPEDDDDVDVFGETEIDVGRDDVRLVEEEEFEEELVIGDNLVDDGFRSVFSIVIPRSGLGENSVEFGSFIIGLGSSFPDGGENELIQVDGDNILRRLGIDDEAVDWSDAEVLQSGTTRGVDWGLLHGDFRFLVGGEVVEEHVGGMAYTLADDITTPEQLGALEGYFEYEAAGGPDGIDDSGNLWSVDRLDLLVNFSDINAYLGQLLLSARDADQAVRFGFQELDSLSIDFSTLFGLLEDGEFFISGDRAGDAEGRLWGTFIGDNGETMAVSFDVVVDGGDIIIGGAHVLEGGEANF